jgi:hypothetical protein
MAGGRQSEGREVGEEGSTRLTTSAIALSFGRMEDAEQRGRKGEEREGGAARRPSRRGQHGRKEARVRAEHSGGGGRKEQRVPASGNGWTSDSYHYRNFLGKFVMDIKLHT